jgi:hypothetical protein
MRAVKRASIFVGSLALVVSGPLVTTAGASSMHVVATAHAKGQYALAETNGEAINPSKIEVVVSSKPSASGLVQWTVGCTKNNKVVPSKSSKKTVKFPAVIPVKFTAKSSGCEVAASVQNDGSGTVTISIESSS